jgi:hypothetical protein
MPLSFKGFLIYGKPLPFMVLREKLNIDRLRAKLRHVFEDPVPLPFINRY